MFSTKCHFSPPLFSLIRGSTLILEQLAIMTVISILPKGSIPIIRDLPGGSYLQTQAASVACVTFYLLSKRQDDHGKHTLATACPHEQAYRPVQFLQVQHIVRQKCYETKFKLALFIIFLLQIIKH